MIPISEIFLSIQGEGRNTGKPSIFIRFRGCNLRCGFCDTPYAVIDNRDMKEEYLDSIINQIKELNCKHIVFTGGEPALFEKYIIQIQEILKGDYYTYEIETNGSIELEACYDQINVSYKTSNSGNKPYEIKELPKPGVCTDYKFVVYDDNDLREVEEIIEKYVLPRNNIRLMPLGTSKESQTNLLVANYCIQKGYRFCQRTHILLFGNKRGV